MRGDPGPRFNRPPASSRVRSLPSLSEDQKTHKNIAPSRISGTAAARGGPTNVFASQLDRRDGIPPPRAESMTAPSSSCQRQRAAQTGHGRVRSCQRDLRRIRAAPRDLQARLCAGHGSLTGTGCPGGASQIALSRSGPFPGADRRSGRRGSHGYRRLADRTASRSSHDASHWSAIGLSWSRPGRRSVVRLSTSPGRARASRSRWPQRCRCRSANGHCDGDLVPAEVRQAGDVCGFDER
jgi:hypothetical protein